MKKSTTFNLNNTDHMNCNMFLDPKGPPGIQRYETVKYPQFEKFTEQQLSFFWRPEEIDVSKDKIDFRSLSQAPEHIFTSNIKRQIALDSANGRGPNLALLPIASLPELEAWIEKWSENETIHSRAYTHLIRNVYPNPSVVFDEIAEVKEIVELGDDISKYYDDLIYLNNKWAIDRQGFTVNDNVPYDTYEHKKAIWRCINSVNALEGLRFYVSFACSWNFAELKMMEGNAKEIKMICRDENLHLGSTQYMLRTLPSDDEAFMDISNDRIMQEEILEMYMGVISQEKDWANYLFQYGSMVGVSSEILHPYIDYIAGKRMRTIGIKVPFECPKSNPLPWTKPWISGKEVQVAPQEVEQSSYLVSDVEQDIDDVVLNNLSL